MIMHYMSSHECFWVRNQCSEGVCVAGLPARGRGRAAVAGVPGGAPPPPADQRLRARAAATQTVHR